MTTTHTAFQFIAGDDWEIKATLLDENGTPYDLSAPPQILWTLYTEAGQRLIDAADLAITIVDAAVGKCSIMVAATKTTTIPGGRFNDALRIVTGGVTSTLAIGTIYVTADPWKAAASPAVLQLVA